MNYKPARYTVSIDVPKTTAEVFNELKYNVPKFWPEEFEGSSAKLNDEFIFRSGDSHYSKNKVTELVTNEKIVWLVTESIRQTDHFDWSGSKMIFELKRKDDFTTIEFTYDGFILADEYDRLVQVCDMVIKERLYNLLMNDKGK